MTLELLLDAALLPMKTQLNIHVIINLIQFIFLCFHLYLLSFGSCFACVLLVLLKVAILQNTDKGFFFYFLFFF